MGKVASSRNWYLANYCQTSVKRAVLNSMALTLLWVFTANHSVSLARSAGLEPATFSVRSQNTCVCSCLWLFRIGLLKPHFSSRRVVVHLGNCHLCQPPWLPTSKPPPFVIEKEGLLGNRASRIMCLLQSGPLALGMREDTGTTISIVGDCSYRVATNVRSVQKMSSRGVKSQSSFKPSFRLPVLLETGLPACDVLGYSQSFGPVAPGSSGPPLIFT
jgi:hypothetical protein